MAEKQLAYRASGKDESFADNDPLAELARIVGFDQRPDMPVAANQRQEPAFDLEDELLREFERYDAPRVTPAAEPAPQASAQPTGGVSPEPVYANDQPAEPVAIVEQPHVPQPEAVAEQPYAPEPEAVSEEHSFAAHAPAVDNTVSSWDPAEESWAPVIEPTTMPIDATPLEQPIAAAPAGGARDLIDELEMSIGSAPAVEPVAPKTRQWAAATIRLPLANFNAARREPPVMAAPAPEPVFDRPAPVADFVPPATLAYPAELDRHEFTPVETAAVAEVAPAMVAVDESGFDLMAAARDGDVQADAALTEPAYAPAAGYPAFDIDDLLADVSRYPVPSRQQIAARLDPSFAAAPAASPVEAAPVVAAPAVAAPAEVDMPASQPVAEVAGEDIESFDDHDFDLDLADIELELAELDFAEPQFSAATTAPSTPQDKPVDNWLQPASVASFAAPAVATGYAPVPERVVAAVAPAMRAAEPVAMREPEPVLDIDQELPFDPNEISDTEDRVESFEDMHVPALPPAEPDEPVAAAPDYDFDIDAEMANLFNAPAEPAEPTVTTPVAETVLAQNFAAAAAVRGVTMQPKPNGGLDEFERALEEDFRRSFRETSDRPDTISQVMFESSHAANDRWRARSMRGIAIAATAIVLISGSAYGMYRWVGHNGSPLSFASGEPRVITADKEPIKVVPTDPGGKIVPNQDKAVYDRVAGDAAQPPKQKELVTSNEEPVDVVQKTLIPENSLPDDSDGNPDGDSADANQSTPVGETEDPRLLPGQGATTAAANQDGNSAVAPRRVRTMIVKPDGSLVAREEAPPADDSVKTSTPTAAAAPTKPATGNTQVASADDSDAPSADSAPIRMVKTTQLANTPASAAPTPPVNTPPVAPAATSDSAPIPTARPTQNAQATPATQPAASNAPAAAKPVVAGKPPAAPKPVQVAAASPAAQPVKTTAAAAASAGGYVMQIASLPSEEEAKRSQANLSSKFGSVIGGHPIEVRRVDIAGKGTYYRVRVAVGSKDDAAALCVKFRAAGGTCLISK